MKKSTYVTIAMSLALIFSQVITLPAAQAATKGWRYWGYFQAAPGTTEWKAAMTGPTVDIEDGAVESGNQYLGKHGWEKGKHA